MAMMRRQGDARVPTMPTGVEIASYSTYLEAQQAVDHLSDQAFEVRQVTIVGTDLRLVERITGRLTYARVAGAGAMSGAWFGLMITVVYWLFMPDGSTFPLLAGLLIGAAFGILFAVVSYSLTGGKRDFTSASQVVASRYSLVCAPEHAGEARQLLTAAGRGGRHRTTPPTGQQVPPVRLPDNPYAAPGAAGAPSGEPRTVPAPAGERPADRPGVPGASAAAPADGRPRYGLRLEDLEDPAPPPAGGGDDDRPARAGEDADR
ncbi:general stress protein [Georgenia yuyongxinii]|nr:general stress protein [Georgenia yuyongxinii]